MALALWGDPVLVAKEPTRVPHNVLWIVVDALRPDVAASMHDAAEDAAALAAQRAGVCADAQTADATGRPQLDVAQLVHEVLRDHGFSAQFDLEAYEPVGCLRCGEMGYRGRIGLFEVMTMSDAIRKLALERAPADQITAVAMREGMRRLRDDGLDKVKAGLTSMAEVARVTGSA